MGDVVGGPLAGVFGDWIDDRALVWRADRWRGHTPLSHSLYWKIPSGTRVGSWAHLDVLKAVLDLDRRKDLAALARAMPREAWV